MEEQVILVDEKDRETGVMEKLQAHQEAKLHRALSVFVFNDKGELLLQRRAADKYHSAGLWTNTCCSHPRPMEATANAAHRRLQEEMGIQCELYPAFPFLYKAIMKDGLTEFEYDHVFFGTYNKKPHINPAEVSEWKYVSLDEIGKNMERDPQVYTAWFRLIFDRIVQWRTSRD